MKCPRCSFEDAKVVESRDASDGDAIRRRRECLSCKHRYTTYERIERPNLAVIKKDGERELFDRKKLFAAIHRSVGKFFSSDVEIEEIAELAKRNEVAYVRFASVYREFKSLNEFEEALNQLRDPSSAKQ